MIKNGFNVINDDEMMSFPSNGWQKLFHDKLVIVLKQAKLLGYSSVIVAGDSKYYGKFGFKLVEKIKNNIGEPLDHFMYLELTPDALKGTHGTIEYPREFNEL